MQVLLLALKECTVALEPDISAFIEQVTCDATLKTKGKCSDAAEKCAPAANTLSTNSSGWSNCIEKTKISETVGSG